MDVSRETVERLQAYWALLQRWNARINLVGGGTIREGWQRHIVDSVQLAELFPARPLRHLDLGSGGGLPAIPVHLARRSAGFVDRLIMIEADGRKAAFLRSACRTLGLSAAVLADRIEGVAPVEADVVTARALAPLGQLLPMVERHLCRCGIAILPKGRQAHLELASAREAWSFGVETWPSRTDPQALILRVGDINQKM